MKPRKPESSKDIGNQTSKFVLHSKANSIWFWLKNPAFVKAVLPHLSVNITE